MRVALQCRICQGALPPLTTPSLLPPNPSPEFSRRKGRGKYEVDEDKLRSRGQIVENVGFDNDDQVERAAVPTGTSRNGDIHAVTIDENGSRVPPSNGVYHRTSNGQLGTGLGRQQQFPDDSAAGDADVDVAVYPVPISPAANSQVQAVDVDLGPDLHDMAMDLDGVPHDDHGYIDVQSVLLDSSNHVGESGPPSPSRSAHAYDTPHHDARVAHWPAPPPPPPPPSSGARH